MTFFEEAAKGKNTHWLWFIVGTLCVMTAFVVGQIPLGTYIRNLQSREIISAEQVAQFYATADFEQVGIHPTLGLILLLIGFVLALAGLWVFVVFVHGRIFRSLVTSRNVNWRKIIFGFSAWFGLTAIAEGMLYLMNPGAYHFTFDAGEWGVLMVVVLLILPLQTSFEEIFIRGYLFQKIGLSVRYPWIAIVITAMIFSLLHVTNPEVREFGPGIMMVYYSSVGLFLAAITVLDDGLEYALGIHAATNVYGAGFVTYQGSALQTDALIKVEVFNPVWVLILFGLGVVIFYLLVKHKYGLQKLKFLFEPVKNSEMISTVIPTENA